MQNNNSQSSNQKSTSKLAIAVFALSLIPFINYVLQVLIYWVMVHFNTLYLNSGLWWFRAFVLDVIEILSIFLAFLYIILGFIALFIIKRYRLKGKFFAIGGIALNIIYIVIFTYVAFVSLPFIYL